MADPQANASKNLWVEYTHQDGRKYYYHTASKQTVWQKPDELKTSKEIALENSPWKEYTTPEGKKYYHSATSKETVWTVPEDYKVLLDQLAEEAKAKETGSTAAAGAAAGSATTASAISATSATSATSPVKPMTSTSSSVVSTPSPLRHQAIPPTGGIHVQIPTSVPAVPVPVPASVPIQVPVQQQQPSQLAHNPPPQQLTSIPGSEPLRTNPPTFIPPPNPPSRPPFSHQQGSRPPRFQQSFVPSENSRNHNRDRNNVDEAPEFSTKEQAEEAFKNLLRETGVTSTWTWEQTMRAVVSNPMYRALKTVAERKSAFQDYVDERRIQERQEERARQQRLKQEFLDLLKKRNDKVTHAKKEEARQRRKNGMAALGSLLQSMENEITLMTRWTEARELLQNHKEFQASDTIQALNKMDQLSVYEDHVKHLEREYDQKRARDRVLRKRTERKRREEFKELLTEMRKKGQLNAKTLWMQIQPLMKEDPRYQDMLGQPGSTPMELFWDMIEDLDEKLYQDRKMIQDLLK
ncbi:PRP40 pre-mRNA processing factor 40, partial [Modicella reniformis]